jgi:CRP-like cAMP-binding protein
MLGDPELFSRLPPELLDQILLRGHEVRYAAGDTIMERGELSDTMMLVKAGSVRVERPGRALTLGVGTLIGEIEVLDPGLGRTATITADTDTTCVAVTRAAMLEGFADDPAAAVALLGILASRFRESG